ncbi:glycosyltransferase [Actinopolymorpha rutila]|uniref:Phosphatidylinositol alpha-1,6-mannosyltransferase n=1 Tax=Actinopolymorpha rutila TaxID=446787 RepID=A0A852ZDA5_9ACTN|nr:phosphatidylinositol alpha-1,6-mannosyltransferase [Actinopolymorpha rutila]
MARTLVVTNDFPTRQGGIEAFVLALCQRMPPAEVVVYTASMAGGREYDATLPFPVIRDRTSTLLPTPGLARRTTQVLRSEGCDRVLFGAAAPLGLLAPTLRRAGAKRIVGLTHGHETWWARVPGPRGLFRRIGRSTDSLTYLGEYTRSVLARGLAPEDAARMTRLTPGVDTETFRPGTGGEVVRKRLGLPSDRPVVVCVARLTERKGQDTLITAWPHVLREVPGATLLVVGDGPYRTDLERLADETGVRGDVVFAGAVPWTDIPPYFDAGDVFAMPCRTRLAGLEPEGLGIVFLEAQASGLPVVVGDSGGAPDAVRHGETGYVVDPYNPVAVAAKVVTLLRDPAAARAMGERGRAWVRESWTWDASVARLRGLLGYPDAGA